MELLKLSDRNSIQTYSPDAIVADLSEAVGRSFEPIAATISGRDAFPQRTKATRQCRLC
ncbi:MULTISPECIES: hypothetical protein [Aerosakkonema]|uniref:hypothetical protein n=1 Tax=Aerosakkonema TaxID=1246629 RepID=UPI0035BC1FFD